MAEPMARDRPAVPTQACASRWPSPTAAVADSKAQWPGDDKPFGLTVSAQGGQINSKIGPSDFHVGSPSTFYKGYAYVASLEEYAAPNCCSALTRWPAYDVLTLKPSPAFYSVTIGALLEQAGTYVVSTRWVAGGVGWGAEVNGRETLRKSAARTPLALQTP